MKMPDIAKLALMLALLFMVFLETGVFTALAFFLIYIMIKNREN